MVHLIIKFNSQYSYKISKNSKLSEILGGRWLWGGGQSAFPWMLGVSFLIHYSSAHYSGQRHYVFWLSVRLSTCLSVHPSVRYTSSFSLYLLNQLKEFNQILHKHSLLDIDELISKGKGHLGPTLIFPIIIHSGYICWTSWRNSTKF